MIRIDVSRKLGAFALDVAFGNDAGITALFGRSGSGKSMTMNLIAGLGRPDRGRIVLDNRVLVDTQSGIFVPRHRRRVGLVFQDAQLFPHFSVRQNLLFGRWFAPKDEHGVAFDAVIDTLGIGHLLGRRPARLSGGEKQRVAIGRALLAAPKILLMDEPLAALDSERKLEILPLIESLRDEFRIPIVYVSHAVEEVARLASRVVVLEHGRVTAAGTVEDVLGPRRPAAGESRFARSSVITGRLAGVDPRYELTDIEHPAGTIWLVGQAGPIGREVRVVIKASDIVLSTSRPHNLSARTVLTGSVAGIEVDDGPLAAVTIDLVGHGRLSALATRKAVDELGLSMDDRVFALVKTVALDERSMVGLAS
jgi:molybdate transport system ATP-binding protein